MQVLMLSLSAGPNGIYHPGCKYDLEDDFARALVAGGYARPVPVKQVETAALVTSPAVTPAKGIEARHAVSVETVGRKPGKVKNERL